MHAEFMCAARGAAGVYCRFSFTVTVCTRDTAAPPWADWKLSVTTTGMPRRRRSAFLRAFAADAVGLIVNVTLPGSETDLRPRANTILAGRHLPASRIRPALHFALEAANTPKRPFWKVKSQL